MDGLQQTALQPAATETRDCAMGCGATGTPEPGYRIFVCGACLDMAADYAETAAARARIEQMPSHGRMLFEFRFD